MSNEEVVGFVKQRIDAGKLTLAEICEEVRSTRKFEDNFANLCHFCSSSTTVWHQTPSETGPAATT